MKRSFALLAALLASVAILGQTAPRRVIRSINRPPSARVAIRACRRQARIFQLTGVSECRATIMPEGWKLFEKKLAHADTVLERSKSLALKSRLWYQLRLGVARDTNWDRKRYQALFNEASRRFP